jgi:hypothetical protein
VTVLAQPQTWTDDVMSDVLSCGPLAGLAAAQTVGRILALDPEPEKLHVVRQAGAAADKSVPRVERCLGEVE